MKKLVFKWLETKDLDPKKINPKLPPNENIIVQYGYKADKKTIDMLNEGAFGLAWWEILGWTPDAEMAFWSILFDAYKKDMKATRVWCSRPYLLQRNRPPPFDYILSAPTTQKDLWEKHKKEAKK